MFLYTREPQTVLDSPPLPPYFFSPTLHPSSLFSHLPLLSQSSDLQPALYRCNLPFLSSFLPLACPATLPCEANVWALIQTSLVDPVIPFASLQPCRLFSATNLFFFVLFFFMFCLRSEHFKQVSFNFPLSLSLSFKVWLYWVKVCNLQNMSRALGWPGPFSALEWVQPYSEEKQHGCPKLTLHAHWLPRNNHDSNAWQTTESQALVTLSVLIWPPLIHCLIKPQARGNCDDPFFKDCLQKSHKMSIFSFLPSITVCVSFLKWQV